MCMPQDIKRYQNRVSQAILDRIDLHCRVAAAKYEELTTRGARSTGSAAMKEQVVRAVGIQQERYRGKGIVFNGELSASDMDTYCPLTGEAAGLLEEAFIKLGLSARGYHRVLRVARTIADLEGSNMLEASHISEALCFRFREPS